MDDHLQILFACTLFILIAQVYMSQGNDDVPLTLVDGAVQKRAVCLDGSPAGYHHVAGSGDGVNNWIVYLQGGGWCWEGNCRIRAGFELGSTKHVASSPTFRGLLSSNQSINPDFYNWNRVVVRYCDGSSFLGDSEGDDDGMRVQFRGSRIFSGIMDDLLAKGMKNANNAILMGSSAGGLATMLHCDGFRARIPNTSRVKCISDSGFFLREENLPYSEWVFARTVELHNLIDFLPTSCTSKMNSTLCLFPQYLIGDIQTPLFLLNSAFDRYEIHDNMAWYPDEQSWKGCRNYFKCTPDQKQRIKDYQTTFLKTLKEALGDNPSRGFFITACYVHDIMMNYNDVDMIWNSRGPFTLENKTISQAISDWYFDRSTVQLIDTKADFALNCTLS